MLKRDDNGPGEKSGNGGGSSSSNGNGGSSSSSSTTTQVRLTTVTTTAVGGTSSTTVTETITSVSKPVSSSSSNSGNGQPEATPASPVNGGGQAVPTLTPSPTFNQTPPSPPAIVSSSTASANSLRVFIFDDPANATLCSPFVLSWAYSGQAVVAMTLTAQPRDVFKSNSTITPSSTSSETRILTTSVLSTADSFTWLSVDVREGWYIAKAFDTAGTLGISAGSDPFYLKQGNDTGCLVTQPISTISISSQAPSSTPSSPKTSIGAGDIVGITLGIIAGLICLLLAAFTFPRLK